ncbi:MAG: plastocyanin/azurin family copper-binding protein [Bacteroidota bacterium]|jgi:plastocyanin|nr:hypothetical protein [Ignavibacteria bacterium]HEX2960521.1 plastocyanin/azurin family copper-binding protein [Ignavibacteriales bacterium]MCU7501123.1 hypothetical protein [Ignavibacteria bacterium]MCU7514518.1 hypothetical protein [Ignavibacteria bacterium]MCU7522360.1 hypothetical protein [Ignavibacteria bacterium]
MYFIKNNFTKNKFRVLLAVIVLALVALAGCSKNDTGTNSYPGGTTGGGTDTSKNSGGGSGGKGTYKVTIQNMSFSPSAITVPAGSVVTWTNMDGMAHTVTSGTPGSPDNKFDSGNMNTNAVYSFTFSAKGTYPYYCRYHSSTMHGTVTVQ